MRRTVLSGADIQGGKTEEKRGASKNESARRSIIGPAIAAWGILINRAEMSAMNAARSTNRDDEAVPPVAVCVRCGLATCGGCAPVLPSAQVFTPLPWEDSPRHWIERLWLTALSSSTEPERVFGELSVGRVTPALGFAILAETLALGSLVLLGSAALWLAAPDLARQLVHHPGAIGGALALLAGAVSFMLVLHALWGISLDVGAGLGHGPIDIRQGARFGLYACGWDLMTSPLGLFWSLIAAGPLRGFASVGAAARAARPAQRAYLEACRGYGADARRRGVRLAVVVVGAVVLVTGSALFGAMLWLSRQLGY
jgi:hypothetical protein